MAGDDDSLKLGFSIWLSLCFGLCVWFLSSFIKGRRLFQNNLHVIEDGLKRMQEELEAKQRERSIGYGSDTKEIEDFLKTMKSKEVEFVARKRRKKKMRKQKVVVDVWKMVFSSCSYLALAFVAYILLKLIYACFWLPNYLQKQEEVASVFEESKEVKVGDIEPEEPADKKNV